MIAACCVIRAVNKEEDDNTVHKMWCINDPCLPLSAHKEEKRELNAEAERRKMRGLEDERAEKRQEE